MTHGQQNARKKTHTFTHAEGFRGYDLNIYLDLWRY